MTASDISLEDVLRPLTVSQLMEKITYRVEGDFPEVHVEGEISSITHHRSGHIYFSLKEKDCVIESICWRSTPIPFLRQEEASLGARVFCRGRVTVFGARGQCRLIVREVRASGTGEVWAQFHILKEKLLKEGVFSKKFQLPPPAFPRNIGILTSPTGAVIQDMLRGFMSRLPCTLWIYPISVQGSTVVSDVLKALHYFKDHSPRMDLLILARGGGSMEDLWNFNEESLVRAVANSTIPVISAIGHETDTTLVDYAASLRAATPTEASALALPLKSSLYETLHSYAKRLSKSWEVLKKLYETSLSTLGRLRIQHFYIEKSMQQVENITEGLEASLNRVFSTKKLYLEQLVQRLSIITVHCSSLRHLLLSQGERLPKALDHILSQKRKDINYLAQALTQLSQEKTLARGFSIVKDARGEILQSYEKAKVQSCLWITFQDGILEVTPLQS